MCRIYGYLSHRPFGLAERMMHVGRMQLHGGPDSQSFKTTPQYGIGANRLAIIDPQGGNQPYNSIPNIYAVLNGEIYNHEELRKDLLKEGYHFPDRCDGTIIPALYQKYGPAFAEHLDGMFTIAILDLRASSPQFILVSDCAGIKPVYYCYNYEQSSFAFATEIPALLQFGLVSNEIWQEGIDHYLTTRAVTGGRTLLKHIHSLPAGHILKIEMDREPNITQYQSRIRYEGPVPTTHGEASSILKDLLTAEVRKLSISDSPICSVNSGGLDSSLLTSLLQSGNTQNTHSFHVCCHGNWPYDERKYAQELANKYNLKHHETFISPDEIPSLIPKMVFHLGQPNCAPHALSTYRLFETVSQKGFKVALTGEGSDELFCGHDRMIRAIENTNTDWASSYLDQMSPCEYSLRQSLYSKEYAQELFEQGTAAKDLMLKQLASENQTRSASIRKFEQKNSLSNYILHRVEPLAMASGVEIRVPFCQPRIMDFSWKLDPNLFLSNTGKGKAIVYGAANDLVPTSILDRPKQPFTLPIISLMHPNSLLMNYIKDTLLSKAFLDTHIFSKESIVELIQKQEDMPSKQSAFTLWALLTFAVWQNMLAKSFCEYKRYKHFADTHPIQLSNFNAEQQNKKTV